MKYLGLLFGILFVLSCKTVHNDKMAANPVERKDLVNKEYAKEYFFIKCLKHGYNNQLYDSIVYHKDVSESVLIDIGNLWNVSDKLDSLAKNEINQIFSSKEVRYYSNDKFVFLDCLNLYKSKKLDTIIENLIYNRINQ